MPEVTAAGTFSAAPKIGDMIECSITPSARQASPHPARHRIFKGTGRVMNVTVAAGGTSLVEARLSVRGKLPPNISIYKITAWQAIDRSRR